MGKEVIIDEKIYISVIITLIVLIILSFNIKPISNYICDSFWGFISTQLNKEEAERYKTLEEGGIVAGKDTVLIWENMYEIYRNNGENHLSIHLEKYTDKLILKSICNYKIKEDRLYIISQDGYAIIDKNNICKVYMKKSCDDECTQYPTNEFIDTEFIQHLNSYDDFSRKDKMTFKNMVEK